VKESIVIESTKQNESDSSYATAVVVKEMRILKSKQNKNGKERKQNKKKTKTEKREKELH
jgi:hypothetical protein